MMPFRTLALATIFVLACSRDRSDNTADSVSSMSPDRPMADTMNRAPRPDTTVSTDSALSGSRITVERATVNGILWGAAEDYARRLLGAPQSQNTVWEEALGDSSFPAVTGRP